MAYECVYLCERSGVQELLQAFTGGQFALLVLGVDTPLPAAKLSCRSPLRKLCALVRSLVVRDIVRIRGVIFCWSGCYERFSSGPARVRLTNGAGLRDVLINVLETQGKSYLSRIAAATWIFVF